MWLGCIVATWTTIHKRKPDCAHVDEYTSVVLFLAVCACARSSLRDHPQISARCMISPGEHAAVLPECSTAVSGRLFMS